MAASKRRLVILAFALGLGAARAETMSDGAGGGFPAATRPTEIVPDKTQRLTIGVMIDGQGPFPFIIDTGADRSVISRELAAALKLPPGPGVDLHSTGGVAAVPTVTIDRMAYGDREVRGVEAPVLASSDLGAMGMLGIDCLHDQQVLMDFRAGTFTAGPSHEASDVGSPDTITVYGRRRFGQLVLVDSESRGTPIYVILDSGAQNTLGNAALRRLLMSGVGRGKPTADVISVTGSHTPASDNEIPEIRLGGVSLQHIPVAYADLETFRQFGLAERPAMLLGMDVLHLFRSVAIDFPRRQAIFVAP